MATLCVACSRNDPTSVEIVWSDALLTCVYVCHHCIWWRCRRKPVLRRSVVSQPPHFKPNLAAQQLLDVCLDTSWKLFWVHPGRPPKFVSHSGRQFQRWLLRQSISLYDTCSGCGGPHPHCLHCGESGDYLFACCKTCIKFFLHCPTLTLDENNRYWCPFDFVRTRYGNDGYRELWIGTTDFFYWLCEGEAWFRPLLTQ